MSRYAIIAPCRNEEKYMRRTLDSLVSQTVKPAVLVVVDDGSTDSTPRVLSEYAAAHDWVRVVTRTDRGARSVGPGVIETFDCGLATLSLDDFEYICKLDLDLELPPRYFQRLIEAMEAEPRLGTCSGKPYFVLPNGRLEPEVCGDEMSVGMTKFYRVSCFRQIGGFVRQVMWDGIDCHRCRMLGWIAASWDDAELRFIHLRPMGSSQKGMWTGRKRHGFGQYFMGTSLVFITASSIYRIPRAPVLVGAVAIWWGYMHAWLTRQARYEDAEFRRFLRRYQWEALFFGKAAAAERATRRHSGNWRIESASMASAPQK